MYLDELTKQLTSNFWAYFIISPMILSGLFFSRLRRRDHFWIRISIFAILYCVVEFFLAPMLVTWLNALPWILSFVLMTLGGWLCFDHSLYDILYCVIVGFAFMFSINVFVEVPNLFLNLTFPVWYALYIPIFLLATFMIYIFMVRKMEKNEDILMNNIVIIFVAVILLFITTGYLNRLDTSTTFLEIVSKLFKLLMQFIIVLLMISFRKSKKLMDERQVLEQVIAKDNENFKAMRSYLKIIDMKCHDFKALSELNEMESASHKLVSELAQSIEEYRNTPKTGNEALDVVLYDKIIICRQKNIKLSYIVDGETLKVMHSVDIATTFNNLLNNSMEYVSKLEDESKRLISMNVYKKYDFLYIQVENYIEEEVKLVNHLPATTKENKQVHGLGLKSVEYVAKKYHGAFKINQNNHLFTASIIIPLNQIS